MKEEILNNFLNQKKRRDYQYNRLTTHWKSIETTVYNSDLIAISSMIVLPTQVAPASMSAETAGAVDVAAA